MVRNCTKTVHGFCTIAISLTTNKMPPSGMIGLFCAGQPPSRVGVTTISEDQHVHSFACSFFWSSRDSLPTLASDSPLPVLAYTPENNDLFICHLLSSSRSTSLVSSQHGGRVLPAVFQPGITTTSTATETARICRTTTET